MKSRRGELDQGLPIRSQNCRSSRVGTRQHWLAKVNVSVNAAPSARASERPSGGSVDRPSGGRTWTRLRADGWTALRADGWTALQAGWVNRPSGDVVNACGACSPAVSVHQIPAKPVHPLAP
jgi:hypothetical protein